MTSEVDIYRTANTLLKQYGDVGAEMHAVMRADELLAGGEKLVPPDHPVRKLGAVLDLSWVTRELSPYYSHTGRPSVDPELMFRMLLVGYVFAIRSERQLCSEVQVNLAYRWFCGLGLEDPIPNHSVFSRARHARFREADVPTARDHVRFTPNSGSQKVKGLASLQRDL